MTETGTSVFIMGFNPHSSDWVNQVATAAIENFFYAIHHQNLTVSIVPENGNPVRIDHQTIDYLFERLTPINRNAVHYYRTIRDLQEGDVEMTRRFKGLGQLKAFIVFAEGSPRRIAHINRNGMLITDSREQKVNPLAPPWKESVAGLRWRDCARHRLRRPLAEEDGESKSRLALLRSTPQ